MVSLYYADGQDGAAQQGSIVCNSVIPLLMIQDRTTLAAYISYARKHINPVLTDAAVARLIDAYVQMRKEGSGRGTITATPRQLESLIRLSEAHARMR